MASLLSVICNTNSEASAYKADVEAGELLGVDMGTTSSAETVGSVFVVVCTATRARNLYHLFPTDNQGVALLEPAPTVSTLGSDGAIFYALGKMDS